METRKVTVVVKVDLEGKPDLEWSGFHVRDGHLSEEEVESWINLEMDEIDCKVEFISEDEERMKVYTKVDSTEVYHLSYYVNHSYLQTALT